jgi:hypothetical protein
MAAAAGFAMNSVEAAAMPASWVGKPNAWRM